MKSKHRIPRNYLSLFRLYLRRNGWTLVEPQWPWEVFRACSSLQCVIIYKTYSSKYFIVKDPGFGVFEKFRSWLQEGDLI